VQCNVQNIWTVWYLIDLGLYGAWNSLSTNYCWGNFYVQADSGTAHQSVTDHLILVIILAFFFFFFKFAQWHLQVCLTKFNIIPSSNFSSSLPRTIEITITFLQMKLRLRPRRS
jgi:hypothetical protein